MKKLLSIVASALTFGAFADAGNTPIVFTNLDLNVGDEVDLVCDGEVTQTITVGEAAAETDTIAVTAPTAKKVGLKMGTAMTDEEDVVYGGAPVVNSRGFKTVGSGDPIVVESGTLDDPTVLTVADVDAASEVVIKSGCAAKVAPDANKTWKITGEGSDSYIILDGTANYGFDEDSKFTNVTIVIDAPGRNVWLEDRATDVYGESVNLIIKQGTVTFGAGKQANPIVSFGTITKEGGTFASNGGTKVVAKTLALGETETPAYMYEGLLWNNDNDGHWRTDTTSASGTKITSDDTVVFNGCDKVLYNHCTTASKIVVSAGTLKIGHDGETGNNLESGSVVTIAQGATVELRCWDSNPCKAATVKLPGVTFNGPGSVTVNNHVQHIVAGTLAGNAPLNINAAELTYTSSTYTGAISGSGTFTWSSGMTCASDWTGTVILPAMEAIGGNIVDLNTIGNANSKVLVKGVDSGWLKVTPTTINVNPTLVLEGGFTINDYSDRYYIFTGIEGEGAFSVLKKSGANTPKSVTITSVDQAKYTGAITAANGSIFTIATLKTTLDALPTEKTKIVTIGADTTDTIVVTTATLADGTAIAADKISIESDGIYVLGATTPAMPTEIAGGSAEQQAAYTEWATTHGITDHTAAGLAEAFALDVAPEDAQETLETLIAKIDLSALMGEGGVTAAVAKLNADYPNATFTLVEVDEIETTANLFRLKVEFNAKGQN